MAQMVFDLLVANFGVMPGLVPGIHAFRSPAQDVDGRDKPGHDESSIRCHAIIR
jgi:hypothetical protein